MLAAIDLEAPADVGKALEASTRRQFETALGLVLEAARPVRDHARTRRDRDPRPTTITVALGRGRPVVTAPAGNATVDAWAREAAGLIRDLADDVAEGIAADVAEAVESGLAPADLAAKWREAGLPLGDGGRLESRLALVADNQVARLNAELARERATAAGLESFRWISMRDSRVRPRHRELDGTIHAYKRPPDEGLPGTPPRCRCHAESVVTDEDLERLLGI
jgi:SPP1 gp7 family putative phage head morphogenesis protein